MIYNLLKKLNIDYDEIEHKAVYTIEETLKENITSKIDGIECKNLFLKNKEHYYLVFMEANKRANLKEISNLLSENKLTFASEDELRNILSLESGSVTPLGILNDKDNLVTVLLDKELENNKVLMHPDVNTKTISIKYSDLVNIIKYTSHKYIEF